MTQTELGKVSRTLLRTILTFWGNFVNVAIEASRYKNHLNEIYIFEKLFITTYFRFKLVDD